VKRHLYSGRSPTGQRKQEGRKVNDVPPCHSGLIGTAYKIPAPERDRIVPTVTVDFSREAKRTPVTLN
jgi:hypothetical protein